ncbi:MAG: LysM peptidoglycan-binding domain-containing protein [Actinomycetota bacterium]|nr:LysM peptidoglycan-binding domain-containing protein [Actinomycetota bacterium]
MVRSVPHALGIGVPFLVVALAGCTGGESDASPSTVPRIGATNYVTQPMVTMLPSTIPGATTPAGGTARDEQEYRVRRGDSVSNIANRYNITAHQLADYNDWDSINHLIVPDDIIKVPPFADVPQSETTVELFFIQDEPLCPDGTEQDTYEVESGDYLGKVAEELDVTIEQLDEANKFTPGYASFYPSLEILVPCPGDETESSSPETTEDD